MSDYAKRFIKEHFLELILSIPKTIYFNFRILPFKDAIKIPFVVSKNIRLEGLCKDNFLYRGGVQLKSFSMRIGFGESKNARRESPKGLISIKNGGKIIVGNGLGLSQGCILIANNAAIKLGNNFRCSYSTTIDCYGENIVIGDDVVCGWNVTIRNGDGHRIIENGSEKPITKEITIGNHVWVCANSTLLKGVELGCNSVVAYGSLVVKAIKNDGVLYGGIPAEIIKKGINWLE